MPEPPSSSFAPEERRLLLDTAFDSIAHALHRGEPLPVRPEVYPPALQAERACFVTLHRGGELCGCIGSLEARRPLIVDAAENAAAAATRDSRFPPVSFEELDDLHLSVSVLSPPEPFPADSEEDLLRRLRPGVDGLIIEDGGRRATFLPAVWESLPEPRDFLNALRRKAGLPARHWSKSLRCARYTAEVVE